MLHTPEQVAAVWKKNHDRNLKTMLLPDCKTSYYEYCQQRRFMGREPLPYEALFEPGDEEE